MIRSPQVALGEFFNAYLLLETCLTPCYYQAYASDPDCNKLVQVDKGCMHSMTQVLAAALSE